MPSFFGKITPNGQINWMNFRSLRSWLLSHPGAGVRAKLVPVNAATADQLAYWFAVPVKLIAERTRYSRAQVHVMLVNKCFGVTHDKHTGMQIPVEPSTSNLRAKQMGELISWVRPWAKHTYGIDVPEPSKVKPHELEDAQA